MRCNVRHEIGSICFFGQTLRNLIADPVHVVFSAFDHFLVDDETAQVFYDGEVSDDVHYKMRG